MNCPTCGRGNPDEAAFCGGCGSRLAASAAQPPPRPYPTTPQYTPPAPTSGYAVASLVFGLLGLMCMLPLIGQLLGLVLGLVALSKIGKSDGALQGQGMAIAGMAVSGVGLLVVPIMAAIMLPVFVQAREKARSTTCLSGVKQIGLGLMMYCQDYDEVMPPQQAWRDGVFPYIKNESVFRCPTSPEGATSYAYNAQADRVKMGDVPNPADAVLVFEANGSGRNPFGSADMLNAPHANTGSICFFDGHCRLMSPERVRQDVMWNPRTPSRLFRSKSPFD